MRREGTVQAPFRLAAGGRPGKAVTVALERSFSGGPRRLPGPRHQGTPACSRRFSLSACLGLACGLGLRASLPPAPVSPSPSGSPSLGRASPRAPSLRRSGSPVSLRPSPPAPSLSVPRPPTASVSLAPTLSGPPARALSRAFPQEQLRRPPRRRRLLGAGDAARRGAREG